MPTSQAFKDRFEALLRLAAVDLGDDPDAFQDFLQVHLMQVVAAGTAHLGEARTAVLMENTLRLARALAETGA